MSSDPQLPSTLSSCCDEVSIKEQLLKIKHSCRCCLTDWTLLNRHLSRAARVGLNKNDEFRSFVKDVIDHFLLGSQLLSFWESVASVDIEKSPSAFREAVQQISTGYRVIANFFGNYDDFPLDSKKFTKLVVKSLHCYIEQVSLNKEEQRLTAVAAIVLLLSTEFQASLIDCLFTSSEDALTIVEYLSSSFVLQSAYIFLGRKCSYIRRANSAVSDVLLTFIEKSVLKRFVERALQDCHVTTVIDALLMQKPFSVSVAEDIVHFLPDTSYIYLLDIVGTLWGEKLFISKGDWRAQEYLTAALTSTLKRISGIYRTTSYLRCTVSYSLDSLLCYDLFRSPEFLSLIYINLLYKGDLLSHSIDGGLPIATILSAGVSSYLDQSDRQSRLRGMRIAREFSVLLGHAITFEELDEEEKLRKERLLEESVSGVKAVSTFELLATSEGGASNHSDDDDGSSDDEIEGYDLPVENPEENVALTPYLRVCLELLLCSDSDKDAHDKLLSSLLSIPRVVDTHPADAGDVCGPLVKELLRLNNSYNTDQFESLRSNALQSLLIAYPHQSVPVMQGALEDESYSLGMRVYVISSLSKASSALSTAPSKDDTHTQSNQHNTAPTSSASTIIKRPLMLAAGKKKVTYFVNKFGPVGPIFFYPILRLLAFTIAKNKSSDIDRSRRGQGTSKDTSIQTNREYQIKPDNFKESFIRNSLSTPELKVEKKVVSVAIEEEDGDGLHSMIPCEALLALAMFVKCSVNTLCQR